MTREHADTNRTRRSKASKGQHSAPIQTESLRLGQLNAHLGYFLRRLQVAVFKDFTRTLAAMEVRPAQYSVLILIEANPGSSQAVIGEALNIERARLARLLHELQRRKWIERRASIGDGRSHSLFLTSAGQEALKKIKVLTIRHEKQVGELVGQDRRILLMDLLKDFG